MAEAGKIVASVGIDHRNGGRELLVGLVMIDHDDINAETLCLG